MVRYQRLSRRHGGTPPLAARAAWLHASSGLALRRMGVSVIAEGIVPCEGLVVSNHLSYMDVLVYASLFPCVFVSKQEVSRWPLLGRFATMAGTIFINRESRTDSRTAMLPMEQALSAGVCVVLFPEGTSSDGTTVLPFQSPYFEAAVRTQSRVSAAALGYSSRTAAQRELAYYGEDVFGQHLLRTLSQRELRVSVSFAGHGCQYADRKQAARTTHQHVSQLAHAGPSGPRPHAEQPGFTPAAALVP